MLESATRALFMLQCMARYRTRLFWQSGGFSASSLLRRYSAGSRRPTYLIIVLCCQVEGFLKKVPHKC